MSLQDLALPVDVPWRLIATSPDMLATHNTIFPNGMWRSSLAVFAYDPDLADLPEVFPGRALTFLKVVCSITSYVPPCLPFPPPPNIADYGECYQCYYDDYETWKRLVEELQKLEQQSYACSGALVQVTIYPQKGDTDTQDASKLAYFASFEPQKRELIEVVTESGESVTQSKSAVNIRKGVTSTDSTEDLNVFTGANLNVGLGQGQSIGGGVTGQWGTIQKSGTESVNTTNTDTSRETREGASHSTSLSQLYHLLNSYHLGTNRAIFFLQPRPHTVQQKDQYTFIDGPQEIEGVQEFFLVVSRPNTQANPTTIDDYCIDALLYTAHLEPETTRAALMETKTIETPWTDLWAASQKPRQKTDPDWYSGLGFVALDIFGGIPLGLDPITDTAVLNSSPAVTQEKLRTLFGLPPSNEPDPTKDPGQVDIVPNNPTILDRTFVYGPGWRIDRTRGLGGYDLWEDPDNATATPVGDTLSTTTKPQAFVDIFDLAFPSVTTDGKSYDDVLNYTPDAALRIRAYVWPPSGSPPAMYHARIKVYFIRDESPTQTRTVPMFVTARGVSSCSASPYAGFYEGAEIDPLQQPKVVAEQVIQPPNVAPWRNQPAASPTTGTPIQSSSPGSQNAQAGPQTLPPIKSSTPSGLDHVAIGSARAKMANELGRQVRTKLKAALACSTPQNTFHFRETELVFKRLVSTLLKGEISRLAITENVEKPIASYIAAHPTLAKIVGANHPALASVRNTTGALTQPVKPQPLAASTSFPLLTLGSPTLLNHERQALHRAGIYSGIDLATISLDELTYRLGMDEIKVRQIRMHALGLDIEEPVPRLSSHNRPITSSQRQELKQAGRRLM